VVILWAGRSKICGLRSELDFEGMEFGAGGEGDLEMATLTAKSACQVYCTIVALDEQAHVASSMYSPDQCFRY
jgi:hypothetical protein